MAKVTPQGPNLDLCGVAKPQRTIRPYLVFQPKCPLSPNVFYGRCVTRQPECEDLLAKYWRPSNIWLICRGTVWHGRLILVNLSDSL